MQIVIDIPEDTYAATCSGSMLPPDVENVVQGIKNGTPLPEHRRKTRKSMDRSDFIIRKKLEHTNDIPAASVGDVGYVSIVGQPVIVLDKNRWGIIFNVSSYGSSTYFTIVYPDCEIESVNSNNVMPDLYRCRVGRCDASDYENWAAVREWVKARMNDKFGAPEEESEDEE